MTEGHRPDGSRGRAIRTGLGVIALLAAVLGAQPSSAFGALTPNPRTGSYTVSDPSAQATETTKFSAAVVKPGEPFKVEFRSTGTRVYETGTYPPCDDSFDNTEHIRDLILIKVGAGKTFNDGSYKNVQVAATGTWRTAESHTPAGRYEENGFCDRYRVQHLYETKATLKGAATRRLRGCFQMVPQEGSFGQSGSEGSSEYDGTVGTIRIGSGNAPCPTGSDDEGDDLASTCGKARADLTSPEGLTTYVKEGRRGCVFLASNRLAQHLLSMAYSSRNNVSESFLELLRLDAKAKTAPDESARTAAQTAFDTLWSEVGKGPSPTDSAAFGGYQAARRIFGPIVDAGLETADRANPLFFIGTLTASPAVALGTLHNIHQIRAKKACVEFIVSVKKGKADVHNAIVYNPKYFSDKDGSYARVFAKKRRKHAFDTRVVRHLNLACNRAGLVRKNPARATSKVFKGWRTATGSADE